MDDEEDLIDIDAPWLPADDYSWDDYYCSDPWGDFKAMMYRDYIVEHLREGLLKLNKKVLVNGHLILDENLNSISIIDLMKFSKLDGKHKSSALYYLPEVIDELKQEEADDLAELDFEE